MRDNLSPPDIYLMPKERPLHTLFSSSPTTTSTSNMATPDLVNPPPHLPPPAVLQLSQSAPHLLSKSPTSSLPYPLSILFSAETPDSWAAHENLLKACLRTGDDSSARQCLDRLVDRFGADNERVLALQGLYAEATAKDQAELNKVLGGYEAKIKEDPTSFVSSIRAHPLLSSISRGKVRTVERALQV